MVAGWGFGSRDKEAENPSAHFSGHSVCQGPWCHSCVSWMYSFETELECYLSEPVIERSDMPLQWWQKNETRFKTLAHLSNKFLCLQHPLCLVKGCSVKWACFMKAGGADSLDTMHTSSAFAIIIWGFLTLHIKIELELEVDHVTLESIAVL